MSQNFYLGLSFNFMSENGNIWVIFLFNINKQGPILKESETQFPPYECYLSVFKIVCF